MLIVLVSSCMCDLRLLFKLQLSVICLGNNRRRGELRRVKISINILYLVLVIFCNNYNITYAKTFFNFHVLVW